MHGGVIAAGLLSLAQAVPTPPPIDADPAAITTETQAQAAARTAKQFRDSGMSRAGIDLLMTELRRAGPNAADTRSLEQLRAAENAWRAELARPVPNGAAIIAAGHAYRDARRTFSDQFAAKQERLIASLSVSDLRIYLLYLRRREDTALLGIF